MKPTAALALLLALGANFLVAQPRPPLAPSQPSDIRRLPASAATGVAASVRVPDQPLVFTGQIFAANLSGDPRRQSEGALEALAAVLAPAGATLAGIVRLNAYVADEASVAAVQAAVALRFGDAPPAFTLAYSPLPPAGARVAFDAIAVTTRRPEKVEVLTATAAVLPSGGKIFISGQVVRGTDLGTGANLTMSGLFRSLTHLGLSKADVVQVKAFIQPFADHAAAAREIAASFAGGPVPPIVIMEWVSDIFAEIELVASAGGRSIQASDGIVYTTLPWLTPSPRFSHLSQVAAGTPLIFISAIHGEDASDPRRQMKTMFERLGSVLFEAGSSYRNLAKATYYLQHPETRVLLGDIRAVYFDPTRAPAASALGVKSLGHPGRAAAIDMIAVPIK